MTDRTHDPALQSRVDRPTGRTRIFPIQNLPYVRFRRQGQAECAAGVAIGDQLLDLAGFGVNSVVDPFMSMPRARRIELRRAISDSLAVGSGTAGSDDLTPLAEAELLLPCAIGDYTDFYASIHHATNVGSMFRPDNPLLPNYKWLPVGYHGRASSIVASGTSVRRPRGQVVERPGAAPVYAASRRLDYELELGAFLGPGNRLGEPIPMAEALDHIVGVCLLNDWSARDIQSWEYQPLGPFLARILPPQFPRSWFRRRRWSRSGARRRHGRRAIRHHCRTWRAGRRRRTNHARSVAADGDGWSRKLRLSRGNFESLYWTLAQMLAHHTSNGCTSGRAT